MTNYREILHLHSLGLNKNEIAASLLTELAIAKNNGTYHKVIQQYKKPSLLILDECLLYSLKDTEARALLEIAESLYKKVSTIFRSQFDVPGWMEKIGDSLIADAICDRSVHNAYKIVIECKESMRKHKRLPKSDTLGICGSLGFAQTQGLSHSRFSKESGDLSEIKKSDAPASLSLPTPVHGARVAPQRCPIFSYG